MASSITTSVTVFFIVVGVYAANLVVLSPGDGRPRSDYPGQPDDRAVRPRIHLLQAAGRAVCGAGTAPTAATFC